MGKKKNEIGKVYGRLEVIEESGSDGKNTTWKCLCNCGNTVIVAGTSLRTGRTKSCGCRRIDINILKATKHGMKNTRTWEIWQNMKQRCTNKNRNGSKDYYARGITYDPKWETFEGFYEDMGGMS